MNIVHNKNLRELVVDQAAYARKVVKCFGLINCKPVRTPLSTGYSPLPNKEEASPDE